MIDKPEPACYPDTADLSDGFDCLVVTETTLTAVRSLPGTRALALLVRWAAPFGFDPSYCPLAAAIVRDLARRRIHYPVIDPDAGDSWTRMDFVQLEAAPPPWPPEIARRCV